jgi:hypothetical protein
MGAGIRGGAEGSRRRNKQIPSSRRIVFSVALFCASLFAVLAVELLVTGVLVERVSVLLGHQSVRITERHYAPWAGSRQEQLEGDLASAWVPHMSR